MSLHDAMERLRESWRSASIAQPNTLVGDVLAAYDAERANPSETEVERLRAENEKRVLQLAACSTLACSNTRETLDKCRVMHSDYECAAVGDVIAAVEREIKLIADLAHARTALTLAEGSLDALRNFFGDMAMKLPVGRAIGKIKDLRQRVAVLEECRVALSDLMLSFTDEGCTIPGHQVLRAKNALKEAAK